MSFAVWPIDPPVGLEVQSPSLRRSGHVHGCHPRLWMLARTWGLPKVPSPRAKGFEPNTRIYRHGNWKPRFLQPFCISHLRSRLELQISLPPSIPASLPLPLSPNSSSLPLSFPVHSARAKQTDVRPGSLPKVANRSDYAGTGVPYRGRAHHRLPREPTRPPARLLPCRGHESAPQDPPPGCSQRSKGAPDMSGPLP